MALAIAGRLYGPERRRYADPATEFDVIRLTDPAFASGFTAPGLHQFTRRSDWLLHWSERDTTRQAYLLNLKEGDSRQLTEAQALRTNTLALTNDEKGFFYFDGATLFEANLAALKTREMYTLKNAAAEAHLAPLADGSVLVAEGDRVTRIQTKLTGKAFQLDEAVVEMIARPRHNQAIVRTRNQVMLLDLATGALKPLRLEPGQTGSIAWVPSGKTFVYLHNPDDPRQLITLRENSPDESSDKLLAKTSQFASASSNTDGSVFTGASRGKASPYVLILLRAARRELTLCEHRASDITMVQPVFSPDSQSVFFASDRHGKPALYRVHVEKFVEETSEPG